MKNADAPAQTGGHVTDGTCVEAHGGKAGVPGLLASFAPSTTLPWGVAALCCYSIIIAWPERWVRELGDTAK